MSEADPARTGRGFGRRAWPLAAALLAASGAAWAVLAAGHEARLIGAGLVAVLWTLALTVPLHFLQLLLSALSWRRLFRGHAVPRLAVFFRLRVMREGIDSLLPVAQVGGEVVAAGRLAAHGLSAGLAGASLVVDLTMEVVAQFAFLLAGLAAVAWLSDSAAAAHWLELAGIGALVGLLLLLGPRLGALRLLEALLGQIAARFPALGGARAAGLHDAALALYRRPVVLLGAWAIHLLAWALGTLETWLVLHALGLAVTAPQALVVEGLGMAARSAGFAVPGALGVQEGGFMLAAMAAGLPAEPALSLSLVKRLREILVGCVGLGLWRLGP